MDSVSRAESRDQLTVASGVKPHAHHPERAVEGHALPRRVGSQTLFSVNREQAPPGNGVVEGLTGLRLRQYAFSATGTFESFPSSTDRHAYGPG